MTVRLKVLSICMSAVVAASLFPSVGLGLQVGSSSDAPTLTAQATLSAGVAKAKVSKKELRSLYKKTLKKAAKGKGVFKSQYDRADSWSKKRWTSYLSYAVYDVDGNGTPELLVHAGSYTMDMCWHMFTVSGKKVQYLGLFGSGSLMSKGKSSGLYVWNQRQGYRWMTFVTILYGKVRSQDVVSDSGEANGYPEYKRYVSANGLKSVKTSAVTKYKLLKSKIS